ncbi:unnamed protein product, partial [Urochloa humidicola]
YIFIRLRNTNAGSRGGWRPRQTDRVSTDAVDFRAPMRFDEMAVNLCSLHCSDGPLGFFLQWDGIR